MQTSQFVTVIFVLGTLVSQLVLCFGSPLEKAQDLLQKNGESSRRVKRNLWDFKEMIECGTGRSAWDFNGYGCYCGWGGSGTPVDATDQCCQAHDRCYDRISEEHGCSPKTDGYDTDGCTTCASTNDFCGNETCECDAEAVRCFAGSTFDENYKGHDKDLC